MFTSTANLLSSRRRTSFTSRYDLSPERERWVSVLAYTYVWDGIINRFLSGETISSIFANCIRDFKSLHVYDKRNKLSALEWMFTRYGDVGMSYVDFSKWNDFLPRQTTFVFQKKREINSSIHSNTCLEYSYDGHLRLNEFLNRSIIHSKEEEMFSDLVPVFWNDVRVEIVADVLQYGSPVYTVSAFDDSFKFKVDIRRSTMEIHSYKSLDESLALKRRLFTPVVTIQVRPDFVPSKEMEVTSLLRRKGHSTSQSDEIYGFLTTLANEEDVLHEINKERCILALKRLILDLVDQTSTTQGEKRSSPLSSPQGSNQGRDEQETETVWRGINADGKGSIDMQRMRKSFVSASKQRSVASRFVGLHDPFLPGSGSDCCLFRIQFEPSECATIRVNDIVDFTRQIFQGEDELLFPPWTTFEEVEPPSRLVELKGTEGSPDVCFVASNRMGEKEVRDLFKRELIRFEEGSSFPTLEEASEKGERTKKRSRDALTPNPSLRREE